MKKVFVLVTVVFSLTLAGVGSCLAFDDVIPSDAYALATSNAGYYILDVRTVAEWQWVGHPGINKAGEGAALTGKVLNISYEVSKKGQMILNDHFLKDVQDVFQDTSNVVLITMCRSGSRSKAAATVLEAAGYNVLNMVTGFEGSADTNGYRTVNAWKVEGLPYTSAGEGYSR